MFLVILSARKNEGDDPDIISVWVDTRDAFEAENRAQSVITQEGFTVISIDTVTATCRDDYFRRCPSLEAFEKAEQTGIAWRI